MTFPIGSTILNYFDYQFENNRLNFDEPPVRLSECYVTECKYMIGSEWRIIQALIIEEVIIIYFPYVKGPS